MASLYCWYVVGVLADAEMVGSGGVGDDGAIELVGVAGEHWVGGHPGFGALECAVFFALDVSVEVFDEEVVAELLIACGGSVGLSVGEVG